MIDIHFFLSHLEMKVKKRKVSCEYYFISLGRHKPSKFHHVLSYVGENVAGLFLVISSGILKKKFSILIYLGDRDLGKNPPGIDKDSVAAQRRQEGPPSSLAPLRGPLSRPLCPSAILCKSQDKAAEL